MATVTLAGGEPLEYTDLHEALVAGSVAGAVVELIDNVDLAGKNWEPIAGFAGTFDGKGFKISNLNVKAESGNGGLFNALAGTSLLRNFTMENVSVEAKAGRAGSVAASGAEGSVVSNITVCGTITIEGSEYVGAFFGHGEYEKIYNCHVDGGDAENSKVTASAKVGGICGMGGEDSFVVVDSSVENITIEATATGDTKAGALMGRFHGGDTMINCHAANCVIKGTQNTIGGIAGRFETRTKTGFIINSSASDVTLLDGDDQEITYKDFGDLTTQNIAVGTGVEGDIGNFTAGTFKPYADAALTAIADACATGYAPIANSDGTYTIGAIADAVAQIGGAYFLSLIDALNAAEAGDTVVMLKDASYLTAYEFGVTLTKDVTLDLNGKLVTIDGSDHYSLTIKDGATLTITDSSEDGNGELRDIGYMSPFILVTETGATGSHLVLNRGKITNTCETYNNRLIRIDDDNDAGSSFTMNGGEISSPSAASKTIESWYYAEATITGGKVVGVLSDNHGADDSAKWGTITIPATSTALFDRDQTAFCAEGYVTDEHGENEGDLAGWWFVTAGPKVAITYDYGAGTAPETANKAAFAAYAADRTFTLTKPTSDAEFDVWTASNEAITFEGDVMTIPADFNEAFTVTATYKAAPGPTWPQDWPGDADEKVVEKFATWSAANPGVDFTSEAVQNAFLMGVNADATIPTLKIESIAVEGDTATIVVSAEGVNLETGINGVLYVDGTNELGAEWATTKVEIGSAAEFTEGKATFTVPNAKFMKAGVGFKAPAVEPVE